VLAAFVGTFACSPPAPRRSRPCRGLRLSTQARWDNRRPCWWARQKLRGSSTGPRRPGQPDPRQAGTEDGWADVARA
jgi:hypothetical protein